jgi:retinol dehydrogenase-12
MSVIIDFFKRQFTHIPLPQQDFTGQTIIVTGSNTGLGLATAEHFVRLGAEKVLLPPVWAKPYPNCHR